MDDLILPETGEYWLEMHYLWEADRVAPSRWPGQPDNDLPVLETPDGRLQGAGRRAHFQLLEDTELRARLREAGVDRVRVFASVVDTDSDAPDGHVRYRRRGTYLEVHSWFHDDAAQETPEMFQSWIREKIRGTLESWLRKKRKRVA